MSNMKSLKKQVLGNWRDDFNRRDFLRGTSAAAFFTMMGGVPLIGADGEAKPAAAEASGKAPYPVAVIGLGMQGRDLLTALTKIPTAKVVTICDTYPAMVKRCKELVPEAETTDDYKTILADKKVKGVIIATPTHKHREIVEAALAAGKHVYCEAPLAHTMDDARAIAQAAKKAVRCNFQAGLQRRADSQYYKWIEFIRSGAAGTPLKARAQWAKKTSWRRTSPNPDREKELNWRLYQETSLGLMGEVGIHQVDVISWFLKAKPKSVFGFGNIAFYNSNKDNDDRTVFDTVQAIYEFPNKVGFYYDATLANSFEGEYEVYYGSDAAIVSRGDKGWMFKESDSPLLGWEVYARKDEGVAYKEAGISLAANATKVSAQGKQAEEKPYSMTSITQALEAFVRNSDTMGQEVENFDMAYDPKDEKALREYLTDTLKKVRLFAPGYQEAYEANVMVVKANESVLKGERIVFSKEWFSVD
jgi:predicted dehydrogenase